LSAWLIVGWLLIVTICATIWLNISWSRLQRRVAQQRPNLELEKYIAEFAKSNVSTNLATSIYSLLKLQCVKGNLPHPDDGLCGFYFDDPEDMEDFLEDIFRNLGLQKFARYDPEITPHLDSVRALGVYLQAKVDSQAN
jgi:hypothetical protein